MMDFAVELRKHFKLFTCHNSDINLSAAMVLTQPGKPVTNAIRQAEELLEQAKQQGRNRIALLDITLPWQQYSEALEDGKFLNDLVSSKQISGSFLYRLLKYYQMYRRSRQGYLKDMLWRSQLKYDMARNLDRLKREDQNRIFAMTTLSDNESEMKKLKISTTYSLYLNRNGGSQ
jgi:CRISPR-associated protein Csm1